MENEAGERLFQILEHAAQCLASGDYTQAAADLDQAGALAEDGFGIQSIMYARVQLLRGRLAEGREELDQAVAYYEEVVTLLEQSSPAPTMLLSGTLLLLRDVRLQQNDQAAAVRLCRRAWEVIAEALAAGEPDAATLAANFTDRVAQVDAQQAEVIYEQSLALVSSPPPRPDLLILLTRRASYLVTAGRNDEAEAAVQEALVTLNALSSADLAEEARSLIILANTCERLQREDDALRLYELAGEVEVAESVATEEYYSSLMGQANIYCKRAEYKLAEERYLAAARVAVRAFGKESVSSAEAAHALADCYYQQHEYSKSAGWYGAASEVWQVQFGDLDLRYARSLGGLALSYDQMGSYAEAERAYKKVLNIHETVLGRTHPETVLSLYNLAELARVQGDYALAEARFLEALTVEEEVRGYPTLALAFILNNLGDLYIMTGRYAEAEEFLNRALAMRRELYGPESEPYGRSLTSIASLKAKQGDYAAAGAALAQARAVAERNGRARDVAELSMLFATMQAEQQGGTSEALASLQSALDGIRQFYGDYHHLAVNLRQRIAYCLAQRREWKAAREQLNQALASEDFNLIDALVSGTRRQVADHLEDLRNIQSLYLSLLLHDSSYTAEDLETAYGFIQRRKGIETRTLRLLKPGADNYEVLSPSWNASRYTELTAELGHLRRRLNRLRLSGDQVAGPGQAESDIAVIQLRIGELEKQLAQYTSTAKFDRELFIVAPSSISYALQEKSVLIEYVHVTDWLPTLDQGTEASRYVAFVIQPRTDEPPRLFDLGDSSQVDAAVEEMQTALIDLLPAEVTGTPTWMKKARFLYNRLIRPLASYLDGTAHIYIAPDGALSTLSFELLRDQDGRLMVDSYTFSYLLAGWEAYRIREPFSLKGPPLILAAPDYDLSTLSDSETDTSSVERDDERIDALRRASRFTDLPNVLAEGESLAQKLKVEAKTGVQALESVLKQSEEAPEIIHVATHGFYLPKALLPSGETPDEGPSESDHLQRRMYLDDPLERTGLAFAGVNSFLNGQSVPSQVEDGILFASEIVDLDLRRTDLVTLVACQTGQGDIRLGEGVQGLRQAFRAAGCHSVISALWNIPDERELMDLFYDQLLEGASRADALYRAKRAIREKYPDDPVYWGGIILDGDPGPLRRFDPISKIKIAQLSWPEWFPDETEEQEDTGGGVTPAQKAQRLFDRALAHLSKGEVDDAVRDFTSVMTVEGVPLSLYAQALYERAGVRRTADALSLALADYDQLLSLPDIPKRLQFSALYDRATTHVRDEDFAAAVADYTIVAQSMDLTLRDRIMALLNRGYCYWAMNNYDAAIADFTAIIEIKGGPGDQRFKALLNRANTHAGVGDDQSAIRDVSLALELGEGDTEEVRTARYFRALRYLSAKDNQSAVADLSILLAESDLSDELAATYLLTRAKAYYNQGDFTKATADSHAALSRPSVHPETASAAQQILAALRE